MIHRSLIYLAMTVMAVGVLLGGANLLAREWQAGYTTLYIPWAQINWFSYLYDRSVDRVIRPFVKNDRAGLPRVKLYIPGSAQSSLTGNMPSSTKVWQRAKMLYPDGDLHKVRVRHRGDNPVNWFFEKKSWRVKTQKKNLLNNVRVFNLIAPQKHDVLSEYLGYWIGNQAGISTPRASLVETWINEIPNGVHIKVDQLDESFLRNSSFMPVNMYKGEQYNSERLFKIDNDLFNNPHLWRRLAVNNLAHSEGAGDLEEFLTVVKNAETDANEFERLRQWAPFEEWSRFAAYQALTQNWGNNNTHNMRLVMDNWRGIVSPVVHDPIVTVAIGSELELENGNSSLISLYNRHSGFLFEKYQRLYDFVAGSRILSAAADHVRTVVPTLSTSLSRDGNRHYLNHVLPEALRGSTALDQLQGDWTKLIAGLVDMEAALKAKLGAPPQLNWLQQGNVVSIVIDGAAPITELQIKSTNHAGRPAGGWYWDKDGDGKVTSADVRLPVQIQADGILIEAAFLSNRVNHSSTSRLGSDISIGRIDSVPTKFDLLYDGSFDVESLSARHALTGSQVVGQSGNLNGMTPARWNEPVFEQNQESLIVWRGRLQFNETQVINAPVRIDPGTDIRLGTGVSLIFKSTLTVNGDPERPVTISPIDSEAPWGVFALQGPGTSGSRISSLHANGGSGDRVGNILFTAMFSIHDTKQVQITGLKLRENKVVDDMVHVVYGTEINFDDFTFMNAFLDAIDIDESDVRLSNGVIVGAGNDGIDLMASKALINNLRIVHSGDKGISIGENSTALVLYVDLENNAIGVETKDASRVQLINSRLSNNRLQLNAYKKNWRYGTGGFLTVEKSKLLGRAGAEKVAASDKWSGIQILDSEISPPFTPPKNVRVIDRSHKEEEYRSIAGRRFDLTREFELHGTALSPR